jgi:hypothetical protein
MSIRTIILSQNISIDELKDMRKRFFGVTMKTDRQYQVLNHVVSEIELILNELEDAKNEADLNTLENQTYEG